MTSLNAGVIGIRLVISLFLPLLRFQIVGEAGIAKIGSLRNLTEMLGSFASVGTFSGVIKYVSQYQEDKEQLQKLFSTTTVFVVFGSLAVFLVLFFGAGSLSETIFESRDYIYLIRLLAVMVPFIGIYRVFNGVVNGLSRYKRLASIELFGYIVSSILTVVLLLTH